MKNFEIYLVCSFFLACLTAKSQTLEIPLKNGGSDCYEYRFNLSDAAVKGDVNNLIDEYRGSSWDIGQGSSECREIERALIKAGYQNYKPVTPVLYVDMCSHKLIVQYFKGMFNSYFGIVKGFDDNYYFVHSAFMKVIGKQEYAFYGLPKNNSVLKDFDGIKYMELICKPSPSCNNEEMDEIQLLCFWISDPVKVKEIRDRIKNMNSAIYQYTKPFLKLNLIY